LFSIVFLVILYIILKPEQKLTVTKEQLSKMYDDLGNVNKEEKGCLVAFVFLIIGLLLQLFLPITINQILFTAMLLMLLLNVLSIKDISQGINWDAVVFFGLVLGFSHIFETAGISEWLLPILVPLLQPIASSIIVFVLALFGICLLLRFFDVAWGWISSPILAMATPMLFEEFGIHPLISVMVFVCSANLFFFSYQQLWVGQAEAIFGDGGWNTRHLRKASVMYALLVVVFLVFCTFYWQIVGI